MLTTTSIRVWLDVCRQPIFAINQMCALLPLTRELKHCICGSIAILYPNLGCTQLYHTASPFFMATDGDNIYDETSMLKPAIDVCVSRSCQWRLFFSFLSLTFVFHTFAINVCVSHFDWYFFSDRLSARCAVTSSEISFNVLWLTRAGHAERAQDCCQNWNHRESECVCKRVLVWKICLCSRFIFSSEIVCEWYINVSGFFYCIFLSWATLGPTYRSSIGTVYIL